MAVPPGEESRGEGRGEKWSMGKAGGGGGEDGERGVHLSPSHTELGDEKEKKAIVADKRAIQLRTPRT